MTGTEQPPVRKGLFRIIALERYQAPLQADTPHILPQSRPGLILSAALIGFGVALLWL